MKQSAVRNTCRPKRKAKSYSLSSNILLIAMPTIIWDHYFIDAYKFFSKFIVFHHLIHVYEYWSHFVKSISLHLHVIRELKTSHYLIKRVSSNRIEYQRILNMFFGCFEWVTSSNQRKLVLQKTLLGCL